MSKQPYGVNFIDWWKWFETDSDRGYDEEEDPEDIAALAFAAGRSYEAKCHPYVCK